MARNPLKAAIRTKELRLPMPHPGQKRVLGEAKRFNVLAAGRRWRKTTLVALQVATLEALRGKQVIWGGPTYDQVLIAWEEIQKGAKDVAKFNGSRMMAEFPSGGRILFRSMDSPDNARGFTADVVCMDEAQDCDESAWYLVLRPMLMDTHGSAWLFGTPKGKNWFWKEYNRISDPDNLSAHEDSMAWQVPALGCEITERGLVRKPHPYENPDLRFEEIQSLYSGMSENHFRQEILAEFIEDAGGVFRGVLKCATAPRNVAPYRGTFVIGVDWGRSKDFTVLCVVDVRKRQVVDFERFSQIDWHIQRAKLTAMYLKWKYMGSAVVVVAEENSIGDVNIAELRRGDKATGSVPIPVQPFLTTSDSKEQAIDKLSLLIETGRISYPNIPALVNELQAFEKTRLPSGRMKYGAPSGENEHDDCVMALAFTMEGMAVTPLIDDVSTKLVATGGAYVDLRALGSI